MSDFKCVTCGTLNAARLPFDFAEMEKLLDLLRKKGVRRASVDAATAQLTSVEFDSPQGVSVRAAFCP